MALSANRATRHQEGATEIFTYPVKASTHIYAGGLVSIDTASGYAVAGSDAASRRFVGVALEEADNSTGSNGTIDVRVQTKGKFLFASSGLAVTNNGAVMYISDDETFVASGTAQAVICGRLARYVSATSGWLEIDTAIVAAATAGPATGVTVADGGNYFVATNGETVLQEVGAELAAYNRGRLIPAQIIGEDGTALTKFTAGATPGWQQLSNKETVLTWDGNAGPTKVAVLFYIPDDLDGTAAVTINCLAAMAGATDTPTLTMEAYFGIGDTDCAGTDDVVDGGATLTEYINTIAASDVPDTGPTALTVVVGPTGTMTTDELRMYSIWLEYTRVVS